jgi:hypothetical protein
VETPATCSALLGAPVLLLVAEPWDFVSAYGRGRLQGQISNIRDFGPAGGHEVAIAVSRFMHDGRAVDALRATGFHPGGGDLLQALIDRRSFAVRVLDAGGGGLRLAASIRRLGPGRPAAQA